MLLDPPDARRGSREETRRLQAGWTGRGKGLGEGDRKEATAKSETVPNNLLLGARVDLLLADSHVKNLREKRGRERGAQIRGGEELSRADVAVLMGRPKSAQRRREQIEGERNYKRGQRAHARDGRCRAGGGGVGGRRQS